MSEDPQPPDLLPPGRVFMSWEELCELPAYECTLPTGPRLGARWRSSWPNGYDHNGKHYGPREWQVAEVVRVDEKWSYIEWRRVTVVPR